MKKKERNIDEIKEDSFISSRKMEINNRYTKKRIKNIQEEKPTYRLLKCTRHCTKYNFCKFSIIKWSIGNSSDNLFWNFNCNHTNMVSEKKKKQRKKKKKN